MPSNNNNNNKSPVKKVPLKPKGEIRIGKYKPSQKGGKFTKLKGFKNEIVHTKHPLSPYILTRPDPKGSGKDQIMENVWQFSKVFGGDKGKKGLVGFVQDQDQMYNRFNDTKGWTHPHEIHLQNGKLTKEYFSWREKGMNFHLPVRYPNGFEGRKNTLYSLKDNQFDKPLSYVEARKEIYFPVYDELVKKEEYFKELKEKLESGKNILIVEVDGPVEESLQHYVDKYGVKKNFIENGTMLATSENLAIMLEDTKHPFGHGYCLAMSLLGLEPKDLVLP